MKSNNANNMKNNKKEGKSTINRWLLAVICLFLGVLGVHRFMVGKIGTGIVYLLTAGVFGIGVLVDLILILSGLFRDKNGVEVR